MSLNATKILIVILLMVESPQTVAQGSHKDCTYGNYSDMMFKAGSEFCNKAIKAHLGKIFPDGYCHPLKGGPWHPHELNPHCD
jgi:hypothetical protein